MDNEHDVRHAKSLATEKDIDPDFGLFTEDASGAAVPHASELLEKQHPDAHVLESHIPASLDNRAGLDDEVDTPEEISEELASVPDADVMAKDSPIDPASPGEEFHGIDLLNGVGNHPEDETEEL